MYRCSVSIAQIKHICQAGLLALGSTYSPPLPIRLICRTVAFFADFVPDHSGGTAPELNRIPSKAIHGT